MRHDADVRAVVAGPDGLLSTMKKGGLIAIHSTVKPGTVRDMAEAAEARGVDLVDAAVSGGPHGASTRSLVCMVGGSDAQVARLRPFIDCFSGTVTHPGAVGAGMALKLCNNLVTYMQLLACIEGYGLAEAGGLDQAVLRKVMTANGNMTTAMSQYLDFVATGPARMGQDGYWAFKDATAELGEKDLEFALGFADDVGYPVPGATATRQFIRAALRSK